MSQARQDTTAAKIAPILDAPAAPTQTPAAPAASPLAEIQTATLSGVQETVKPEQPAKQDPGFFHYYLKSVFTGLMVAPVSSTLTYPVDKISFVYQTLEGKVAPTFFEALKAAFRKPFAGYVSGIINASSKNIFMYPSKQFFQAQLDQYNQGSVFNTHLSGLFAGIVTVYCSSPISVIKALCYSGLTMNEIRQMDYSAMFRGVHATAQRDGVQFGVFFGSLPIISHYTANPALSGAIAGLIGAIFSNPLSVIAMNQKVKGSGLFQEGKFLYNEGGTPRFYRGFFRTTALRMSIQGAATSVVIEAADKIYNHMIESKRPTDRGPKL